LVDLRLKIASFNDEQIKALIENHRRLGATDQPTYLAALEKQARRMGRGLSFEKSVPTIWRAAAEGRFLAYKDLADASGVEWNVVHYSVGAHLWQLIEYAHRKGWPILSAVVVNKPNVQTGTMDPDTLKGFANAAAHLGYHFDDAAVFLRQQQEAVFAWGQTTTEADLMGRMNADR
jgi:hypothetical protein